MSNQPTCDDCGGQVPEWIAPMEIAQEVAASVEFDDKTKHILCPTCFMLRADKIRKRTWMILPK